MDIFIPDIPSSRDNPGEVLIEAKERAMFLFLSFASAAIVAGDDTAYKCVQKLTMLSPLQCDLHMV